MIGELDGDPQFPAITWEHDPQRDGAGCTNCGSFAQVDEDNWCRECCAFRPHDIKVSHITGDSHCKLCMDFHPVESCPAPMARFTSDNGTEWIVVLCPEDDRGARLAGTDKPVLRFYDLASAGKPGFNALLGQYVAEYYAHTLVEDTPNGLDLHMGIDAWKIDGRAMFAIVAWVTHTEFWTERRVTA